MDTDKLIKAVAREIDPIAWVEGQWEPTRHGIEAMHERRQNSCVRARAAILAVLEHEPSKATVESVARAMYDDSEDIYEEPWDGLREDAFIKGHYRSNAKIAIKANADTLKAELE